uniref:histidine kinase n=1 Tax=candidate division WOR-3 bacterium TaxID=2052148 RepID=A0A7C4XEY0_UNCW3
MKISYPGNIAIIAGLFIVLIIFLAIVNLYIGLQLYREYRDTEVSKIATLARLCAIYLNKFETEDILKNLSQAFDLAHLVIYDTLGNKIYDSYQKKIGVLETTDYLKNFKVLPAPGEIKFSGDDIIYHNLAPAFFIYTRASSSYSGVNRVFQWHIFYITISLVLISFLGIFLIRNLFLPVQYVANVAKRYGVEMRREDFVPETFNEIFKRMKEKEKELVEFSSFVAHEFRNSLATITALARLVEKGKKSGEEIIKECNTLNAIISNLLEYARTVKLNISEIDLNLLIDEALKRTMIPERIFVKKKFQPQIKLNGDYELLLHSFINIFKNGVAAISGRGTISITTKQDEDSVFCSISDTGTGIPKDKLDLVFSPFYSERAEGVGLGLAYVKKIVELHNGEIKVNSEKNRGTEFIIRIPKMS